MSVEQNNKTTKKHRRCDMSENAKNTLTTMANTYTQINVHIVFAVKGRENLIKSSFREELQMYISGIVRGQGCKLLSIYCMPDHTHLLIGIKPDLSISELVRDIKANSSTFIKKRTGINFSWQTGFGAFSYSKSQIAGVAGYIEKQPEHHKKTTFIVEYTELMKKFEIEFDERYVFETYDHE